MNGIEFHVWWRCATDEERMEWCADNGDGGTEWAAERWMKQITADMDEATGEEWEAAWQPFLPHAIGFVYAQVRRHALAGRDVLTDGDADLSLELPGDTDGHSVWNGGAFTDGIRRECPATVGEALSWLLDMGLIEEVGGRLRDVAPVPDIRTKVKFDPDTRGVLDAHYAGLQAAAPLRLLAEFIWDHADRLRDASTPPHKMPVTLAELAQRTGLPVGETRRLLLSVSANGLASTALGSLGPDVRFDLFDLRPDLPRPHARPRRLAL